MDLMRLNEVTLKCSKFRKRGRNREGLRRRYISSIERESNFSYLVVANRSCRSATGIWNVRGRSPEYHALMILFDAGVVAKAL